MRKTFLLTIGLFAFLLSTNLSATICDDDTCTPEIMENDVSANNIAEVLIGARILLKEVQLNGWPSISSVSKLELDGTEVFEIFGRNISGCFLGDLFTLKILRTSINDENAMYQVILEDRTMMATGSEDVGPVTSAEVAEAFLWVKDDIAKMNFTGHVNVSNITKTVNGQNGTYYIEGSMVSGGVIRKYYKITITKTILPVGFGRPSYTATFDVTDAK